MKARNGSIIFAIAPSNWAGRRIEWKSSTKIRAAPAAPPHTAPDSSAWPPEVVLGKVGIVLMLEASRLARNNSDWYRLIEICGVSGTLIADESAVYNPREPNDRLLLGVKGTISEAELFTLRTRLYEGSLEQGAQRAPAFFFAGGLCAKS